MNIIHSLVFLLAVFQVQATEWNTYLIWFDSIQNMYAVVSDLADEASVADMVTLWILPWLTFA